MTNKKWKSQNAENTCPSCAALHGQVHSEETWGALIPGSDALYCQANCHCEMLDTDEPESGSIADAPLRQSDGMSAPTAGSSLPLTNRGSAPERLRKAESLPGENNMTDFIFQLKATPSEDGFDVLAISEGEAKGHGITFSSAVLQEALPLYDGIPVFIDHAGILEPQSVRNLAGTLHAPSWNAIERGIQLKLKAAGPASEVLLAVRDAAKKEPAIMKAVGFSSVVNVQLNNKREVTKIVRVKSTDVVIDPARGGKFLSAFNPGQKGEKIMTDQINPEQSELTNQQTAALELQGVNETIADLQDKQKQANDMLIAQCVALLDSSLSASKLPQAAQKALRKPFDKQLAEGKPFLATELQEAIKDKREELSEISAGNNVQGPGRVFSAMFTGADQFRLALEDLFGMERETAEANVKVRQLRGIQEAYLMATGDVSFMGGYYPEFSLVTANFPGIVANVMNKILVKAWKDFEGVYGWWQKIVSVEHFTNLNQVSWVKTGTIASLPTVAERGEYTELNIGDNRETTDWTKYGGYIPITIEAMLRDDIGALKRMPREAALGGIRNISEQVAAIFTQASGAGPNLADGGALFNSSAVTTATGHANLLTTALGTDFTAWDAAALAVYNQPLLVKNATGVYGTGKKQAIEPTFCLVPRALKAAAEALFIPRWAASIDAGIAARGGPTYGGYVTPLTVPEWTDATDWAAAVDPQLVPGVMIGEIFGVKPQVFVAGSEIDPAMFANDESRIKVRQFLAVGVSDFRPLHKSNVA